MGFNNCIGRTGSSQINITRQQGYPIDFVHTALCITVILFPICAEENPTLSALISGYKCHGLALAEAASVLGEAMAVGQ